MAKSKFDYSLLTPVDEKKASFEANLTPIEESPEEAIAYLDNLPKPQGSHPFRDILIGLTHAGRNLHNLPHDLVQGLEKRTEGIGKAFNVLPTPNINKKPPISSYLPYDDQDYSDVFGMNKDSKTLIDKLIQGGVEYAPDLIGAGGLLRGGARRLTGTHYLDKVEKAIKQKGIQNFSYPKNMTNEAQNFLPKTQATKELLGEARAGNYDAAFKLQSQIGHHQRQLSKSPLASENSIMAPKAGELKQNMLAHLEKVLRDSNLVEEADLLKTGISNYKQYKKVRNAAMPVIKYLGIPTSILSAIVFGYSKAKKVLGD